MLERLEQLLQIKEMCLNELKQAEANFKQYSHNMAVLTEDLNENGQIPKSFLAELDSFITNITTVMNDTRKFNIKLHLYNKKLSEIQEDFARTRKKRELKNVSEHSEILETVNQFYPAEVYDLYSEDGAEFSYPTVNLSEVYKTNDVISGIVTYIKNLKDLSFYIFDNSTKYRETLVDLSKTLELRQYHSMPTAHEVFGCVLDNQIFRAVFGTKIFYDVEMNEEVIPCYILDTGEILPLKRNDIMYKLTNYQKSIPAQALLCKIKTPNKNPFVTESTMEEKLKTMEYKKCKLKILEIVSNTLYVEVMDKPDMKSTGSCSKDLKSKNATLETDQKQLTEEELNIIYEESLNTSNAMRAVMGYDPQDDKRICRFYNPSTGSCFKGVNCKLEHTPRQPDGWTKDILPSASIIDSQHPMTVYDPESIINITPTYIGQLDRFFAQINDPYKTSPPLVWTDKDVPSWKHLQKPPHMYELVLSRYVDGFWYRGKIMSHDDDYKMFKIFYVDYGNVQMVNLHNLASIDFRMAQLPFKAIICRFETVKENQTLSADDRKNGIEILCEMILNKSMDVKVVSHYEDLFISFLNKKDYPLPDILIEMGLLEESKNQILL